MVNGAKNHTSKQESKPCMILSVSGRVRTCDPLIKSQMLCQLSYGYISTLGRVRTYNLQIRSLWLYPIELRVHFVEQDGFEPPLVGLQPRALPLYYYSIQRTFNWWGRRDSNPHALRQWISYHYSFHYQYFSINSH